MKIKIGEKVYLQKYEILKMGDRPEIVAECVHDEFARKYGSIFTTKHDLDVYKFEYVFEDPECVKWLMEQDFIIDYDTYAGFSESRLDMQLRVFKNEYVDYLDGFHEHDEEYRSDHHRELMNWIYCNKWKSTSIAELLALKRGAIPTFGYPEGYTGKKFMLGAEVIDSDQKDQRRGFFGWFLNLFSA